MEKKNNLRMNQVPAKVSISESRKNIQDQPPRNLRRKDIQSPRNYNNDYRRQLFTKKVRGNNTKNINTNSANADEKGFRNHKDGYPRGIGSTTSGTRLDDDFGDDDRDDDQCSGFEAELNSVYLSGSKKQNLNHLLNFNYAPRERTDPLTYVRSGNINKNNNYIKRVKYNKEQFLQANCQFVVKSDGDYTPYTVSPDLLVEWSSIEQIHLFGSTEEPQCPICLYHPVAAKMTRCGHVYCWPCILHYLALSEKKSWRKCPICFEAVHIGDLKSAVSKPHRNYTIDDYVTFELMCRNKNSLQTYKAKDVSSGMTAEGISTIFPYLTDETEKTLCSKLLLAKPQEIMSIIERERNELQCQLTSDGIDCTDSMFVEQALSLLEEREKTLVELLAASQTTEIVAKIGVSLEELDLNENVATPAVATTHEEELAFGGDDNLPLPTENFVIDEDSDLTINDIDIVPTNIGTQNKDHFYFYQSNDGQHLYLHSLNVRMLQSMYGALEKAPHRIIGKMLQKESCSMSEELRKRLKYLQHLPVSCQFEVVEIALEPPVISNDVMRYFKEELRMRQKTRQRRAREERKREKHIDRVNEQQFGKFMRAAINIDVTSDQHFPMCGSFEDPPLSNASVSNEITSSPGNSNVHAGPSFAKMLTSPKTLQTELWPTLAAPKDLPVFSNADFVPLQSRSPKVEQPGSSSHSCNNHNQRMNNDHSDDDSVDCYSAFSAEASAPPEFKNSFGCAIAEALNNASLSKGSKNGNSLVNGGNTGARNKKKKKVSGTTLLFSTGGRTFDGK